MKEYKKKPKMVMLTKKEATNPKKKKIVPMKLKKKLKPKTRMFKDGKEVTY